MWERMEGLAGIGRGTETRCWFSVVGNRWGQKVWQGGAGAVVWCEG